MWLTFSFMMLSCYYSYSKRRNFELGPTPTVGLILLWIVEICLALVKTHSPADFILLNEKKVVEKSKTM